jgi:hypothetical protein
MRSKDSWAAVLFDPNTKTAISSTFVVIYTLAAVSDSSKKMSDIVIS